MPLTRPRFTVRRLMAAVAVAAVLMMLVNRHNELEAEADYHDRHVQQVFSGNSEGFRRMCIRNDYHGRLAWKYRLAAWLPFLPVLPDPPQPSELPRRNRDGVTDGIC